MVASDSLFETETRVVVHIRDVNDLPPVFDRGTYVANTVEEYAQPDRRILKVGLRCLKSSMDGVTKNKWWWHLLVTE